MQTMEQIDATGAGATVTNMAESMETNADQAPAEELTESQDVSAAAPPAVDGLTALTGDAAPAEPIPAGNQADKPSFTWDLGVHPAIQYDPFCELLAKTGKLYRDSNGQLIALESGKPSRPIRDGTDFEAFIRETILVQVVEDGKHAGFSIPQSDLKILMRSVELKRLLPVVDRIVTVPTYNSKWELTHPGYNPGPAGENYFFTGELVQPKDTPERIMQFLAVMAFKSMADKVAAVALALTILLRCMWPGKKPFAAITANKSHAGKDTVLMFATGCSRMVEISWHRADWALQNEAVSTLHDPDVAVLTIGNVRASHGSTIQSAFLERIVTSTRSLMQSSKRRGDGYMRDGDFVVAATANDGKFSPDLMNRSLPIYLEQIGDIGSRKSDIGDPKNEYLPLYREEIQAELIGMVERWKAAGKPQSLSVRHPMIEWARTIGGILEANGFTDFLANWNYQRDVADAEREALAIVAHATQGSSLQVRDGWLRVESLVKIAKDEGVIPALMETYHRASDRSMMRRMGVVLKAHLDETVSFEDDAGVHAYCIRRHRIETDGTLATVYKFEAPKVTQAG